MNVMLFKPAQLGLARLDSAELEADRKACKKIGPCGVGKKALYLNSFYIDRRYYLHIHRKQGTYHVQPIPYGCLHAHFPLPDEYIP